MKGTEHVRGLNGLVDGITILQWLLNVVGEDVDEMKLVHVEVELWCLVILVMNFQIPYKAKKLLTS